MLKGSLVAIATPMLADGAIDEVALRALVDWHIAEGTHGIVVVGTTGESPTVDYDEHCRLIDIVVAHSGGRIPVIAGTGANSTREAIELAAYAKKAGANYSLSVVPYYNKPNQDGLYAHFKAIAEAVDMPHILYNVPGRTVADLANDTALKLAQIPNIVGIKDATGNMERATDLILRAPDGFALYSGDDASALAFLMLGGHGSISVTANVAPGHYSKMCEAAFGGDYASARQHNAKMFLLHQRLFCEANPIPVKWALQRMGRIGAGMRLPLVPLNEVFHERVLEALRSADIKV
ncbi:MAG: 4-hydroxy-tetrahydrodipicolinate synthase [Betaproteobacteria bacterium]|jgi:4-hydroxy-tetrahydrodipicolinate synthase|nr:4-hydroxy-tetrahydrodipicolinate synthase [Betaproteobacteria bacterium]NBY52163.1 4-hydroxy-tetrahydrodipicolinate synthase [Betaproteobacteria bacterium]NCA23240.1 4-hydroxy-tetrahydrodipicolinate synthase [Betaproteobacteria bacterium]NCU94617.1 4-hydroxy-tetrahydrodipicolinate synthase [Betaproteobacteria bacterium]